MTNSIVIASKVVAEVHVFAANFSPYLSQGEGIVFGSWVVSVSVYSGIDPTPTAILDGSPTISGNTVSQQIQLGVVGVTYRIVTRVTTTLGYVLSLDTYLAVLPNNYPANGVFITLYETSQPYPAYSTPVDTLRLNAHIASGILQSTLFIQSELDTLHVSTRIVSGTMFSILFNQSEQDTMHVSVQVTSGMLTTVLVNQPIQDTLHLHTAISSGSLLTILINNNQQDTMHLSVSIASGTLT